MSSFLLSSDAAERRIYGSEIKPLRFVVIAAPRTGSNMLCSMLNSHPEILCHHELFNPEGIHCALDWRAAGLDLGTMRERDGDPLGFLGRVWRHTRGASAAGFKLNRGQSETIFHAVLADRTIRKIILVRRNLIRTYLSEFIAERSGQWESYAFSDKCPRKEPVRIEVRQLQQHIATNDRYYVGVRETLRSACQSFLEVEYEDLPSRETQQRLLRYLAVEADVPLEPATRRMNGDDLRASVANYDELRATLAGSDLEIDLEATRSSA